ncbi:putative membrane protein [Methanothermobacter sp. MT-2]|nr:putative membrane protein [Methanothermobacter sp. MT-2]
MQDFFRDLDDTQRDITIFLAILVYNLDNMGAVKPSNGYLTLAWE